MLSTELSTAAMFIGLALSIIAFIAAYGSFAFCLKVSRKDRDYRALFLFCQELEDNHAALLASHKKLRSRVGMRELRAKRNGGDNDDAPDLVNAISTGETPEEFKARVRKEIHLGKIKP